MWDLCPVDHLFDAVRAQFQNEESIRYLQCLETMKRSTIPRRDIQLLGSVVRTDTTLTQLDSRHSSYVTDIPATSEGYYFPQHVLHFPCWNLSSDILPTLSLTGNSRL